MEKEYDVVVVGAGSAGCALAYRLAASSSLQVLLLEAGSAARNPMIHIPLGFAFLMKDHPNNWGYRSQPEPHASGRAVELPRGKVLCGTSAINGMVYVRGQAEDYERWARLGNDGWSYDEVLPYFKRSEDCADGASHYHGRGGPLHVGRVNNDFPVSDAFIEAAQQAGHPFNADINADSQDGVAWFPTNIKNGRRWTSARAFLGAGSQLPNLTVVSDTPTERVLFNGKRAIGVSCLYRGKPTVVGARREVVLSAGAINSPQLLELSGIGQAERLQALAIDVVQDLPGVGENLHDHWNAYIKPRVAGAKSYFSESKPLAMLKNLLRYLLMRRGFLANPAALVTV
ncbi:MAG: GMC family oxidoreductase N-terminal domain-containing protein, partial [Oceanisphaera sp.]|nr:GMC family oxidoreductase N-terminal domain-containing protein [Oceanisphaera sp.]